MMLFQIRWILFAVLFSIVFSVSAQEKGRWKVDDVVTESLLWCLDRVHIQGVVSLYLEGNIVEGKRLREELINADSCRFLAGGVVVLTSVQLWKVHDGVSLYMLGSSAGQNKGVFAVARGLAVAEI